MKMCGKRPLGYLPCPRDKGHDGPCAHEVDLDSVAVDLRTAIPELTGEELDELYWRMLEGIYGKRGRA